MGYERSAEEWLEVCKQITDGHVPLVEGEYGGKQATYREAVHMPGLFIVPPPAGARVLDIGCGNGRLAMALVRYDIEYLGIDPMMASVAFCREAFKPWPNFRFEHAALRTPTYTPDQAINPLQWDFPVDSRSVDWAAAISVFTHLETEELAAHYVDEFRRVVKPGGVLWSTWFRAPPNEATSIVQRTAYRESEIINLLREWLWLGTRNGLTTAQHDQWHVWTQRRMTNND